MTKVTFVKKAYKDNPVAKRGESYYWWQFRYGGKQYSKTYPKPAQLTQSEFLQQYYSIQEKLEGLGKINSAMELLDVVMEIKDDIQCLLDETQEKLESMPDQLRESSSSGELLQERVDELEGWLNDIDGIDVEDFEFEDPENNQTEEEWLAEKIEALSATDPSLN